MVTVADKREEEGKVKEKEHAEVELEPDALAIQSHYEALDKWFKVLVAAHEIRLKLCSVYDQDKLDVYIVQAGYALETMGQLKEDFNPHDF